MKKLNISEFFSKGCTLTNALDLGVDLEHEIAWNQVLMDEFEYQEEQNYQPQRIPTWDKPLTKSVPMAYEALTQEIIESGFFDEYFKIFGKFDQYEHMLHHTCKGYENLWHGHFKDASHVHILCYFGSDNRQEPDGGKLEVGRIKEGTQIDFDQYHLVGDLNKVETTGSFACNHGDIAVVWNLNPYILHQVTKVLTDTPRYTYMIACGYKSNIDPKKRFSTYL
jgi:hypothetical protein